ncbi:hypothetical protein O1611_g9921 [Lasiodiplodia mahajangana]|uniref:Uncharacterized protein n=1 Tax=Lasiodiplodia mahajangana TaxID=1108764 RepID=A0ACC2J403_9PEZI|nr:hypothetical protein O1611_g9921 [Lasiodiplodia mahajangana]
MLAWHEPDGEIGAPSMLHPAVLRDGSSSRQEAAALDFKEAPTTATTPPKPADPRWQRDSSGLRMVGFGKRKAGFSIQDGPTKMKREDEDN